jgi:class 3 adenylate cyclase/pimeloyl-ACP methyl ester carboxylesterase
VAYCLHGSGTPLVYVRGWVSNLELLWESPPFRDFFLRFARSFQVLRFDNRGQGLSEREPASIALDDLVADLEAVADAAGFERFVLFGASYGVLPAVVYAARHPERVEKLVLANGYANGARLAPPDEIEKFLATFETSPEAASLLLARRTQPEADSEVFRRADNIWRSLSPRAAAELYRIGFTADVSEEAGRIQCPTLVLQRRGTRVINIHHGRELASLIPGSEFVSVEGSAQNPWDGDTGPVFAAIGQFLEVDLEEPEESASPAPVTILFTDIADSTPHTRRLGDQAAYEQMLGLHNRVVRGALRAHGGAEVKHTGDGIMASFSATSNAVACALAIQDALTSEHAASSFLRVRIGLNAGEPIAEGADLFGTAVTLARRICDVAAPGTVFVSGVVRELVAGRDFAFRDAGAHRLKGFDEPVRLWELAPAAPARTALPAGLSEREAEVLRLIALGRTNQQIAEQLVISPNTVARHVAHIFDKTGAANRTEAARFAALHGLTG